MVGMMVLSRSGTQPTAIPFLCKQPEGRTSPPELVDEGAEVGLAMLLAFVDTAAEERVVVLVALVDAATEERVAVAFDVD